MAALFVTGCCLLSLVAVGIAEPNQPEGSICFNKAANSPGICRRMMNCRWAAEEVNEPGPGRGYPEICSFRGNEPLVCCPTSPESIVFPSSGFLSGGTRPPLPAPPPPAEPERPPPPVAARPPSSRPPLPLNGAPGSMADAMCVEYEKYAPTIRYNGKEKDCVPNHTYPIGGNPALAKEFPHMALLAYGERSSVTYDCGGSLISLFWVLTAAHCVFAGDVPVSFVMLGELVISETTDDAYPQLIPVAERVMHPGYKPPQAYNDIALLRLQWSPNMTTGHVRPACLHVKRELDKEKLYLTGWGHTSYGGERADAMMEVALYRTKYEECTKYYGSDTAVNMPRGVDDDTQLCAGAGQLLKDACNGDSGGPLQTPVIKPMCMYRLAGVVSLGQGCGLGAAGIYTRISYYVPWIEKTIWPDPN